MSSELGKKPDKKVERSNPMFIPAKGSIPMIRGQKRKHDHSEDLSAKKK